jgi:hypothetical protein
MCFDKLSLFDNLMEILTFNCQFSIFSFSGGIFSTTKLRNVEKIGRPGKNSGQSSPARPIFSLVFSSDGIFQQNRNSEKIGRPGRNSGQSSPARHIFSSDGIFQQNREMLRKLAGLGETLASLLQPGQFFPLMAFFNKTEKC